MNTSLLMADGTSFRLASSTLNRKLDALHKSNGKELRPLDLRFHGVAKRCITSAITVSDLVHLVVPTSSPMPPTPSGEHGTRDDMVGLMRLFVECLQTTPIGTAGASPSAMGFGDTPSLSPAFRRAMGLSSIGTPAPWTTLVLLPEHRLVLAVIPPLVVRAHQGRLVVGPYQ